MKKLSPEALRRLRLVGAKVGVFLFVFVVALYIWFPYDRAKEMAINMAATQGIDVDIESAGPTFGVGISFSNIHVKTRPTTGKPTRFSIEKATVTTSVFSILLAGLTSSTVPYTITLDAFGGRVSLAQKGAPGKKGPFRVEITARDVSLAEVPGIREAINLPVTGTLKLDLDISSPTGKFANTKGDVSFLCGSCVLGDGKTPLKVEGNAFLGGGLTLPKLRVGDLGGDIAIENGAAKLKGISAKSPDGEISLEGDVSMRDPLVSSMLNAYLRFKLSDAFLRSAGTVQTILQMAGASGRRPDGSYGVRISGRLGAPSMMLSAVTPTGAASPSPPPMRPGRPCIMPYTPPPPQPQMMQPSPMPQPNEPPPPPPPVEQPTPPPPPPTEATQPSSAAGAPAPSPPPPSEEAPPPGADAPAPGQPPPAQPSPAQQQGEEAQ
jgi:type II secretion system protein N